MSQHGQIKFIVSESFLVSLLQLATVQQTPLNYKSRPMQYKHSQIFALCLCFLYFKIFLAFSRVVHTIQVAASTIRLASLFQLPLLLLKLVGDLLRAHVYLLRCMNTTNVSQLNIAGNLIRSFRDALRERNLLSLNTLTWVSSTRRN